MSISFGGLGLMSLRKPFAELVGMALGKGDIRTTFCVVVFSIVLLVLAYLTNPSENSFRAYLTEQSFRQHLSRLDDNADDDHLIKDELGSHYSHSTCDGSISYHTRVSNNSPPFHFANRASVSLRTPKHVFRSFGIFTIAAMLPIAKSDCVDSHRSSSNDRDRSLISDSWFIGAFGKWWCGGVIGSWYQDVSRSADEESWSSGILRMETLDKYNNYTGLPFSNKSQPPYGRSRGSPPKLRNRERPSQKLNGLPTRSSTPPPLPESASLPFHAARSLPSATDRGITHSSPSHSQPRSQPPFTLDQVQPGSTAPSRSPSTLFDQSPRIAEVLRQIALSKTSVLDLRTQLTECQSLASQSHTPLQLEVDSYRDRKRQEDASKVELKSRTKTLEDSKRNVESTKRDSEKRLKSAQNARDHAVQRLEHLDKEIAALQQRSLDDQASVLRTKEEISQVEQENTEALIHKRQEIKICEDVVAALNARTRVLEDKLSSEKEKLRLAKERAEIQKQDRSFYPLHVINHHDYPRPWPPVFYASSHTSTHPPSSPINESKDSMERSDLRLATESDLSRVRSNSHSRKPQTSPRPPHLALSGLSNFNNNSTTTSSMAAGHAHTALRTKGYSIFEDNLNHLSQHAPSPFSPFGGNDSTRFPALGVVSSTGSSLTPPADIMSRPFQSDGDVSTDRDWRSSNLHARQSSSFTPITNSQISFHGPPVAEDNHDPFEVRILPPPDRPTTENVMDMQLLQRTHSDPKPNSHGNEEPPLHEDKAGPRRWFSASSKGKAKKGLNPDAKVFSISRKSPPDVGIPGSGQAGNPSYDALNPNGLGSSVVPSTTSTNSSLLRAFAPSPAEREALQRALGGSTNTSLERLPSLSDVGSIRSSPAPADARRHDAHQPAREMGKVLPSWLQSLPRIRKPNFSPWDDDESIGHVGGNNE